MKACRFHHPDYLSAPEAYANARCRGSGPPNEKRQPGGAGVSEQGDDESIRHGKPTARQQVEHALAKGNTIDLAASISDDVEAIAKRILANADIRQQRIQRDLDEARRKTLTAAA